jgi:hypothetical protein
MSRDQFEMWCRVFAGTTIRALRHIRHVPRASMRWTIHPPITHHRRATARLPLAEIEAASAAHART